MTRGLLPALPESWDRRDHRGERITKDRYRKRDVTAHFITRRKKV